MALIDLVREPVRTIGFIRAVVTIVVLIAARFGMDLAGLEGPLMDVFITALAVLAVAIPANEATRDVVTPVQDPKIPVGTVINDGTAVVEPRASVVSGGDFVGPTD